MIAKTPKGKTVTVNVEHYGTAQLEIGKVYYGTIYVSGYSDYSKPRTTLKDALIRADEIIDDLGLEEAKSKKNFTLSLEPNLIDQVKRVASDQNRSLSNYVEIALQDRMRQDIEKNNPGT